MLSRISTIIYIIHFWSNGVRGSGAPAVAKPPQNNNTTSVNTANANAAQKASLANAVATLGVAGSPRPMPGASSDGCETKSVDGQIKQVNNQLREQCKVEKIEAKLKMAENAKKLVESNEECVEKVSPEAMNCHMKREVNEIVNQPFYGVEKSENITEIDKNDKPLIMTVSEPLIWDVSAEEDPKSNLLDKPGYKVEYNRLGFMICESGELPKPKKDSPCEECLVILNKKEHSVDGQTENCGKCDTSFDVANVHNYQFKIQKEEDKSGQEGGDDKNKKKTGAAAAA